MPVPTSPQDLIDLIREKLFNNTSGLIEEPDLREVLENIVKVLDAKFSMFSPNLTEEQFAQWNLILDYMANETKGVLSPTSPAPTEKGKYILSSAGTYANLGGLVAAADKLNYAYFDGTTWSKVEVETPKGQDGKTIENWSAKAFLEGSQVFYDNAVWQSNEDTIATDIPTKSLKWKWVLGGKSENTAQNGGKIAGLYIEGDFAQPNGDAYIFSGGFNKFMIAEATDYDRFFIVKSAKNIVGNPQVGFNTINRGIATFPLEIGKVYKMDAGWKDVYLYGYGGSAEIEEVYLGVLPYATETKRIQKNFFNNTTLNGFENVIEDNYGNKKLS